MPILFIDFPYFCGGNSSKMTIKQVFMYRVSLHKVNYPEQNCFFKNGRSEFYLSSSDEVCLLISKLPKGWFITILDFDLDTVDSIFEEFNFDCV